MIYNFFKNGKMRTGKLFDTRPNGFVLVKCSETGYIYVLSKKELAEATVVKMPSKGYMTMGKESIGKSMSVDEALGKVK